MIITSFHHVVYCLYLLFVVRLTVLLYSCCVFLLFSLRRRLWICCTLLLSKGLCQGHTLKVPILLPKGADLKSAIEESVLIDIHILGRLLFILFLLNEWDCGYAGREEINWCYENHTDCFHCIQSGSSSPSSSELWELVLCFRYLTQIWLWDTESWSWRHWKNRTSFRT